VLSHIKEKMMKSLNTWRLTTVLVCALALYGCSHENAVSPASSGNMGSAGNAGAAQPSGQGGWSPFFAPGGIGPVEASREAANNPNVVILDVRGDDEYAGGHIPNSTLIPLHRLEDGIAAQVPGKNQRIIAVCASGGRSQTAVATLRRMGYTNTAYILGGMNSWRAANLPIEGGR
jgi:rhodanese-related sulfurtransferase